MSFDAKDYNKTHEPVSCLPKKPEDVARLEDIVEHIRENFSKATATMYCVHIRTKGDFFKLTPEGVAIVSLKEDAPFAGVSLCPHCLRIAADDLRLCSQNVEDLLAEIDKHDATNEKHRV
jgi:hypothetical protein